MVLRITQAFGEWRCLCSVTREKLKEQVLCIRPVPCDWLVPVVSVPFGWGAHVQTGALCHWSHCLRNSMGPNEQTASAFCWMDAPECLHCVFLIQGSAAPLHFLPCDMNEQLMLLPKEGKNPCEFNSRTSNQHFLQLKCSVLKGRLEKYLLSKCITTSDRFFFSSYKPADLFCLMCILAYLLPGKRTEKCFLQLFLPNTLLVCLFVCFYLI